MRDLTKSLMSFSWAMSMFGLKQALDLLNPQNVGQTASSFEEVTRATESQLGSLTRSTFQAGDQLQRRMIDMAFGMFGWGAWNPNEMIRMGTDAVQRTAQAGAGVMQQSAQAMGQMMPGGLGWNGPRQRGWGSSGAQGGWGDSGTQEGGGWGDSGAQQGGGWPSSGAQQESGWGPMPQQDCGCQKS